MQLHCELSVNIFLNFLRRVCPAALAKFLKNIGLPVEPDRYDYNGNQCRKVVVNWAELAAILPSSAAVLEKSGADQFIPQMFDCMRQIPACLEGLDFVISRTMSRRLHPEWHEAFKKLSTAFENFEPLYRNCVPASENDPRCLLTPKLRCLLVYVEKWIEETGETLIGVSEGAFETFHQDYRLFEINFKVPRPPPGKDETKSETTNANPYTPSCGTRSGAQRKRKAAEDNAAELAKKRKLIIDDLLHAVDTTATESKVSECHKSYVKRQRVLSVAAHTAWNLYKYSDRLEEAAHFSSSRKRDRPWNTSSFLTSSQGPSRLLF